jgi:hypothetical protein
MTFHWYTGVILALAGAIVIGTILWGGGRGPGWPIRRRWYLVPEDGIGVAIGPFWTRGGAIDARRRMLSWNWNIGSYDLVKR